MIKPLGEVLAEKINKCVIINQTNKDDSTQEGEIFEISDNELEQLDLAHRDIYEYQLFKRKVQEIRLNFSSFHELITFYEKKLKEFDLSKRDEIHKEMFVNFNRVLTNFAASLKSFIDDFLVKNQLPKIYGINSTELETFKKQTSIWYDSNISYKFLIRLRDYAIHYNFPIYSIEPIYDLDKYSGKVVNVEITPYFNKEKLLKNSKFKNKLEPDLLSYNTIFPVIPMLDRIVPILNQFESVLIDLSGERYKKSAQLILSFYNRFTSPTSVLYGKIPMSSDFKATKLEHELCYEIQK